MCGPLDDDYQEVSDFTRPYIFTMNYEDTLHAYSTGKGYMIIRNPNYVSEDFLTLETNILMVEILEQL